MRKRRKKSLARETDVIARFQGCFPDLAAALSECGCGVVRMRAFSNVKVSLIFARAESGSKGRSFE